MQTEGVLMLLLVGGATVTGAVFIVRAWIRRKKKDSRSLSAGGILSRIGKKRRDP